jgi:hypothetical protein
MNEKTQNAIIAMQGILAAEVGYLVDQEGCIDDFNNKVTFDDLENNEASGLVSEANTVIFFGELIERIRSGWVPTSPEECKAASMGYYYAIIAWYSGNAPGYTCSDSADNICEDLMEAFGIAHNKESANARTLPLTLPYVFAIVFT